VPLRFDIRTTSLPCNQPYHLPQNDFKPGRVVAQGLQRGVHAVKHGRDGPLARYYHLVEAALNLFL
jgi:hypothetical protein